jgi:hypothetical protein
LGGQKDFFRSLLELGPTRESDSLLAIELVRNREGDGSTIQPERRAWKPDLVTFCAQPDCPNTVPETAA